MASSNSYAHKLTLAYDGTNLFGWQKTKEGPSVQEAVEEALAVLLRAKVTVEGCSRTDRGVHAEGQVASFVTTKSLANTYSLLRGMNALLPPTIRVLAVDEVPASFHPALDASLKEYRYSISQGSYALPHSRLYSWHCPYELDLDAMREAAAFFCGTHDFAAFTNSKKNEVYESTIRHLKSFEIHAGALLEMRLVGNHFLYKMVRNLVGTVVYVGRGKIALEELPLILQSKDRRRSGITAPAHGLTLRQIYYGDYVTEKRSLLVS